MPYRFAERRAIAEGNQCLALPWPNFPEIRRQQAWAEWLVGDVFFGYSPSDMDLVRAECAKQKVVA